jgi:hypothetical protein
MRERRLIRVEGLAALIAAGLALGCESEKSTGTVVGPLAGPRVAESVLCLGIVEGLPDGITEVFEQSEDVHLWVHWEALTPPHTAEAVWYDPDGREADATTVEITGSAAEQVTVFRLALTSVSRLGRWSVDLRLDGEFMRGHAFLVVQPN